MKDVTVPTRIENIQPDFCIEIDFEKESQAPSRIFRTLSDLIDAFHAFDLDLIQFIEPKIEPILLLEDIEAGSLRTWLKYALNAVDDEALKKLDWRPAIGKYLVKAKYIVINWCEGKTKVSDREEIRRLGSDLHQLAKETDVLHIPAYTPPSPQILLSNIDLVTRAVDHLAAGDSVKYTTQDEEATFNLDFHLVPESIEELLTKETIEADLTMILKVKKPDYLGVSKWEMRYENRTIYCKILDSEWLSKFQKREVDVRPGDSIRADVHIKTRYGYDMTVLSVQFDVMRVIDVIPAVGPDQDLLL